MEVAVATRTARITLIDDDPDVHLAVRMILEPQGHQLTCYQSGPAGLQAIRNDPPDLVLLDIMLTHPSEGLQIACEMRRDAHLKHIPLILLSAIGESVGMEYSRQTCPDAMPADLFVEKPFDAAALRDAVSWVLEQAHPDPLPRREGAGGGC
jgi:CheY-like chemotaxis protein